MDFSKLMDYAGRLKRIKRTGWVFRGIPEPESVAEHSFRAALLGYFLSMEKGIEPSKVVGMLLIHDLAESVIGDITPEGEKFMNKLEIEERAIKAIAEEIGNDDIYLLWIEFNYGDSEEAKLVREVDKAEMAYQGKEYQKLGYPVDEGMLKYLPKYLE
jgi:putative hydrolase of HD superfamily